LNWWTSTLHHLFVITHHFNYISFSTILLVPHAPHYQHLVKATVISLDENTMDRTTAADALDGVDFLSRELPGRPGYVITGTTWTSLLILSSFSGLLSQTVTITVGPKEDVFHVHEHYASKIPFLKG
jgi:hypothetical protein